MNFLNSERDECLSFSLHEHAHKHIYTLGIEAKFRHFEFITSNFFTQRYLLSLFYTCAEESETVVQSSQKSALARPFKKQTFKSCAL